MITYQDYLKVGDDESKKAEFVHSTIFAHKASDAYKMAEIAEEYAKRQNRTIIEYEKLLYTVEGKAVPDMWGSNFKMPSGFFQRFIIQENQFLMGNGISWTNDRTADQLDDSFDAKLKLAGKEALIGGVSFGFWNYDHLDVFKLTEFAPLYDEEDGSMKAGIRFWQIDQTKPLRATFYEPDGYTDYIWGRINTETGMNNGAEILNPKQTYTKIIQVSTIDGRQIYNGENYPTFPIVPLWGNEDHQSEIVGLREQIDCYDLIKSGYANSVDEGSIIFWLVQNAGGMDNVDLAEFVEKIKTLHAVSVGQDQVAEPHQIEAPYESRESLLTRLRSDLYEDAMALDIKNIAGGALTATQIRAAYELLNEKVDGYEECVKEFLRDILTIAGIDDQPTFTRSILINKQEEVNTVLAAATDLDSEYVTRKILTILGDADQAEEIIKRMDADELDRARQPEQPDYTNEDDVNE